MTSGFIPSKAKPAPARAHPLGAAPWRQADYVRKFRTMTEWLIAEAEAARFLEACEALPG